MYKSKNIKMFTLFFIVLFSGITLNTLFNINSTNISADAKNDNPVEIQDYYNLKNSDNIPAIPELLYPLNNSIFNTNIVQFNWSPVGQPSDKVFYDFVMDNDTDFKTPELARFALNDWSNFTMSEDQYTTFIAHFNDTSLKSAELEDPTANVGCKLKQGKFGNGVLINSSEASKLTYKVSGNLYKNNGTIEFWVKLEKDIEEITGYEFLFDYIISISPTNRIVIAITPDLDRVYAETWFNTTGRGLILPPDRTLWKKGEWHHVCLAWGNEMGRLYLDGLEVAASTNFPIGNGTLFDDFSIGSQYGGSFWVNATFDEMRISTIQRIPVWKPENGNINGTYLFGVPFYRYNIWNLNETEFYHMFERDDTYFWKVRAHNASGPSEWSKTRVLTINRTLDQSYQVQIKILDKNGFEIPNVNVSYQQKTISKLMGVDANYISELLKAGAKWYHEGNEIDFYSFLASRHSNSFRTRLWTNTNGNNNLANATNMARWAQNNGSIPYLTIFLSDEWADVNRQPLPKIFEGLSFEERLVAIEDYCHNTAQHFIAEGINMEFYEIGNEIDFGLCGTYADASTTPRYNLTWMKEHTWYNESRILKAAISGVKQADPNAEFMLHIAISDPAFAMAFFTAMKDYGVSYDIIGLSYHPVSNGDGAENGFKETVKVLSCSGLPGCDKIVLPETSYSSQINGSIVFKDWNRSITEFPLTSEGQKQWVKYQLEWIYQHPNIIGMNYWSPELYNIIWQGFSWFNGTGHSKIVVDAYPDFFNKRNISIDGWDISNSNGNTFFQAYRGKVLLKVQVGNHIEYFNISVSPFRSNNFNVQLSINIIIPATSDDDDGKKSKGATKAIPGYDLLFLISILFLFSLIAVKKRINIVKGKID